VPAARVTLPATVVAGVAPIWDDLRRELGVPDAFPPEVLAVAAAAAASPRPPDLDRTDLPPVTVDPEGSRHPLRVRLAQADPASRRVLFRPA
jgi:hypothetical protein